MGRNRKQPNRKLIEYRLNKDLTPNQVAYATGLTGPTIRLAERGHIPSPRVQLALADFYGVERVVDLWPLETQKELAAW